MATDSEMLADVETVIQARLNNQATDGFNVRQKSWQGTPLSELFKIREMLQNRIDQETRGNGGFSLIDPIQD